MQKVNFLSSEQIRHLHVSIREVTLKMVRILGEPGEFPIDWLLRYTYFGTDEARFLPSGEEIELIRLGDRLTCKSTI